MKLRDGIELHGRKVLPGEVVKFTDTEFLRALVACCFHIFVTFVQHYLELRFSFSCIDLLHQ